MFRYLYQTEILRKSSEVDLKVILQARLLYNFTKLFRYNEVPKYVRSISGRFLVCVEELQSFPVKVSRVSV